MTSKWLPTFATLFGIIPALPLFLLGVALTVASLWPFDPRLFVWSCANVFGYVMGCYAVVRLFRARPIRGPYVIAGLLTGIAALIPVLVAMAPHETALGIGLFYCPLIAATALLLRVLQE